MANFFEQLVQILVNYILIPAILAIIPIILLKVKDYVKTLSASIKEKSQNDSIAALNDIISYALDQLETVINSAVSANMAFAEKYKAASADGKLTDDEINELKAMAKQLTYDTLPVNFKNGDLLDILGGPEALDKLITAMIEKVLIDIKSK